MARNIDTYRAYVMLMKTVTTTFMTDLTKEYFEETLTGTSRDLKAYADDQTEKLARMITDAFATQNAYLEKRFEDLEKDLDVRSRVLTLERRMEQLEGSR